MATPFTKKAVTVFKMVVMSVIKPVASSPSGHFLNLSALREIKAQEISIISFFISSITLSFSSSGVLLRAALRDEIHSGKRGLASVDCHPAALPFINQAS
jgi:hypothetical protein